MRSGAGRVVPSAMTRFSAQLMNRFVPCRTAINEIAQVSQDVTGGG
jgi:hypothetical protein